MRIKKCPRCKYPLTYEENFNSHICWRCGYTTSKNMPVGQGVFYETKGGEVNKGILISNDELTQEVINEFRFKHLMDGYDINHTYLTRWNEKEKKVEILFGKIPKGVTNGKGKN